jgi:hypothetical protein
MPVCVYAKRTVTSTTPWACKLVADNGDVASLVSDEDSVQVHFIGAGACKLMLEIGELAFNGAMAAITVSKHTSGGHHWDD